MDNLTLCKEYIEQVWNQHNPYLIGNYIFANYTIYHHPGDPWNGQTLNRSLFEQRLSFYQSSLPDLKFTIEESVQTDNQVMLCWIMTATHSGEGFPPVPATDLRFKMTGMTLYYFQDGLIRGHWQEQDNLGLYSQLDII